MGLIGVILFFVFIPAGIAWALATGLARMQPDWSLRRRTGIAALTAGLVPVLLPIFVVALESEGTAAAVAIAALLLAALVVALLIGLPVALSVGRRLQPLRPDPCLFD
ncbi:MAG: hypothetical protein ACKOPE_12285 [Novosphingobium sp.]